MTTRQQRLITFGVLAVAALLFLAVAWINAQIAPQSTTHTTSYAGIPRQSTPDGAPILGSASAPVTLVLFTDFSCPHCITLHQQLPDFITRYVRTGETRLELRVLGGLDPEHSLLAAKATLCAGDQNRVWEMVDALTDLQVSYGRTAFTEEHIESTAERLQLNPESLLTCIASQTRYQQPLQNTAELAQNLEIITLPTLLIRVGNSRPQPITLGGEPVPWQNVFDQFGQILDETASGS